MPPSQLLHGPVAQRQSRRFLPGERVGSIPTGLPNASCPPGPARAPRRLGSAGWMRARGPGAGACALSLTLPPRRRSRMRTGFRSRRSQVRILCGAPPDAGLGRVCRVHAPRAFARGRPRRRLARPLHDRHRPRTGPPGSARIEHRPAKPEIDRSNRSAGTRSRPHGPVEWSPLCRSGDRGFESPWGRHSLRRGASGSAAGCYPEGCRFESCRRSQSIGHR